MYFIRTIAVYTLCLLAPIVAQAQDWGLAKDKNGVKVYTSSISGSSYKATRTEFYTSASADRAIAVLKDVANYPQWQYGCAKASILKQVTGDNFYYYLHIEVPIVADRDFVGLAHIVQQAQGGYKFEIQVQPDYIAAKDGLVRLRQFVGYWTVTPMPDGTTKVERYSHTSPGGSVPAWLTNSFLLDEPYNTMLNLKKRL